jgi:glutamyl-tRNA reductase
MIERLNRSAPHRFREIDMKLFVAGVSHKTAPVEVRGQLAVKRRHLVDAAEVIKLFGHLDEVVLLSTGHRLEFYGTTRRGTGHVKSLLHLLSAEPCDLDPHIYLYEGTSAVRHLLGLAAGLDSPVPGETEIAGQIKNAYEIARHAGLTGRVLDRLFQKALQATKKMPAEECNHREASDPFTASSSLLPTAA